MKKSIVILCIVLFGISMISSAYAGKIIIANDEWVWADEVFDTASGAGIFATNVASWFTDSGTGTFLAYSENQGLIGSRLSQTMTNAGHTWIVSAAVPFTLETLSQYDGVFLGGGPATSIDTDVLTRYVQAGGNVYLMSGTRDFGLDPKTEADRWNPFITNFGLGLEGGFFNGISGVIPISSNHQIFNSVTELYQNNGNDILDILPLDDSGRVLITISGHGLYAVYDSPSPVPIPGAVWLFASGIVGVVAVRRRAKNIAEA